MKGETLLYIDQWGQKFRASTIKELREKVGGGGVSKMYQDKKNGDTVHVGYIVGAHWLTAYKRVEIKQ